MNTSRKFTVLTVALLAAALGAPTAAHPHATNTPAVVFQTEEEALLADLTLVAQSQGWTVAQAAAQYDLARAFGRIQGQVATGRPELYAGAALSVTPTGAPTLYLKGRADDVVRNLVATAGFPIVLVE